MPHRKGLLDHIDNALYRFESVKRRLLETADPSVVRAWKVEQQDGINILLAARSLVERQSTMQPHPIEALPQPAPDPEED